MDNGLLRIERLATASSTQQVIDCLDERVKQER